MPAIERILCPVDFSETSEHALRYAVDLAERLDAEVHLVHAYHLPTYALPDGAVLATPDFYARLTTEVNRQLDELAQRYSGHGPRLHVHAVEGVAYRQVVDMAKELNAGLIVMGTHGRSGLTHFLLGSVAERVVRCSDIPVLTVRKPS